MNRILRIITVCCMIAATLGASAQSATALYNKFVEAAQQPGNKGVAFTALWHAYDANMKQLKSSKNSTSYQEAKDNLLKMWPYLENGAIHFSSENNQTNAVLMSAAYLEMPMMDDFKDVTFTYSPNRAQLAYYVASYYFNKRNYEKAIPFLNEYLKTGDEKMRKDVFVCMIDACERTGNMQLARATLDEASRLYPNEYNFVAKGVNICQDMNDYEALQGYLDKARVLKPYDQTVLNIQAKLYEDTKQYDKALEVYVTLLRSNPKSLELNKHVALNLYNLATLQSNKAMVETDNSARKRQQRKAKEYYEQAADVLEQIVASEPASVKYNTALAVSYSQLDKKDKLAQQNERLSNLGVARVNADTLPQLITYAGNSTTSSFDAMAQVATPKSSVISQNFDEIPTFSSYAKDMIEAGIKEWQQKDPYETISEYQDRVTETTRDAKVKELRKVAEEQYIKRYGSALTAKDFTLKPYDAENGVFLIDSKMGQLVVPVPRSNNEARLFEQNWNGVDVKDPLFCISDDKLAIAEVTFITPTGNVYKYNNAKALTYTETKVDVQFDAIDYGSALAQQSAGLNAVKVNQQAVTVGTSDVDQNIPKTNVTNDRTFAVIIANENYGMVTKVPMAINDGATFAEYCKKTLGLPDHNVMLYKDASYGVMLSAVKQLKDIAVAFSNEDFKVIFYYAGHGIPNEATKDGYLLPTDANGQQTEVCYSLNKLYGELGGLRAKEVVVFLDACFSGAEREGGMLASARGVAIATKKEDPRGNMVVFSAATGDETAYPYKDKGHGLFTYYLLKKLQETSGDVTLSQLGDYITDNVRKQSIVINHKSQTPTVVPSTAITTNWSNWKLK